MMDVSDFDYLECLTIAYSGRGYVPYLRGLSKCCNLRTLKLINLLLSTGDLEEVSRCEHLVKLEISKHVFSGSIIKCSKLRTLKLKDYLGEDLRIITGCPNLRCIELKNCSKLRNVDVFGNLKMLTRVKICGCCELKNVDVLEKCERLKYVRIVGCPNIMYLKN